MPTYPERIVCLTEETTETLYLLGEGQRVAGISGYTLRPPEARIKPKVSPFISARYDKIEALQPDLVLTFSDLQADITAELVKRGLFSRSINDPSPKCSKWCASSRASSDARKEGSPSLPSWNGECNSGATPRHSSPDGHACSSRNGMTR